MRTYSLALVALIGSLSTACAQTPGPQDPERREQIKKLEAEIHEMEAALKRDDVPDERRAELRKRLDQKRGHLKELLGDRRGPGGDPRGAHDEKMRRLHEQIRDLQAALERRDLPPEKRKELTVQLDQAHARLAEHRAEMKRHEERGMMDPMHRGPSGMGPQDHRGGPPPDPELHKLHMEAQELDRASMELAGKLRSIPPDKKDERDSVASKMKETVSRLFDVREKARAREIEMLKKRLEELTQMLDKRKQNRDAIIEKRIKQLTGEADPLDW